MKIISKRNTTICLLLILLSSFLYGAPDPLPSWYLKIPDIYEPIKADVLSVIMTLREEEIPGDTIGLLVLEGAAKDVEPVRLIGAINLEVGRLLWLKQVLESSGYDEMEASELAEPLGRLSLFLQSGVERGALESLLRGQVDLEKVLYAGEALGKIVQFAYATPEDQIRLANAMIGSNVPSRRYSALASTVLRGLSAGLSPDRLLDIIVEVLNSGGGILQIDQEIRSRGRAR